MFEKSVKQSRPAIMSGGFIYQPVYETNNYRAKMRKRFFLKSEAGATAVEYGLIAAIIALVISASLILSGSSFNTTMKIISDALGK